MSARQRVLLWLYDGPNYRTWILHGLASLALALLVNPPAALTYYWLRELESLAWSGHWNLADRIPDVLIPTTLVSVVWWFQ